MMKRAIVMKILVMCGIVFIGLDYVGGRLIEKVV